MARGGFFEPLFETVDEVASRIVFPRSGSNSVFEELSWSWFVVLVLAGLTLHSIAKLSSKLPADLDEATFDYFKKRLRYCRLALLCILILALFMLRFASWF